MSKFVFENYSFDSSLGEASFGYRFEGGQSFVEKVQFAFDKDKPIQTDVLDATLFLAFIILGVSYYKTFPSKEVVFENHQIDDWQADFLNHVYQEGLSQFAFENGLEREDLAKFVASGGSSEPFAYSGEGTLCLQSGGKDSLLTATVLSSNNTPFDTWYLSSSDSYPSLLDDLDQESIVAKRLIDHDALNKANEEGAKNGHVPVTYIVSALALVQAVLSGKNAVVSSIGHEGEEPHAQVGDLDVTHQWSKTWLAEQLMSEYVNRYISTDMKIGSSLRAYSELRVAELFVEKSWDKFGREFSSCNRANYLQGQDNTSLKWCGECPKCANSFLLFAPFVESDELKAIFGGKDLFDSPQLGDTFKGLLGVEEVMKPLECVGEVDELRLAYNLAIKRGGYAKLPFEVPESSFDYKTQYPHQSWARLNV